MQQEGEIPRKKYVPPSTLETPQHGWLHSCLQYLGLSTRLGLNAQPHHADSITHVFRPSLRCEWCDQMVAG